MGEESKQEEDEDGRGDLDDDDDDDDDDAEEVGVNALVLRPAADRHFKSQYNYAGASNGAKVGSSNPEAKSPGAALKEDMDSYYLTPCVVKTGKWLTVELSEEAAVTAVVLANFEFHSSGVREFELWGNAGGNFNNPEDWSRLARCKANSGREPQTFVLPRSVWTKFVQIRMTGHYGSFHFCTMSLFRVHGKDAKQTLKEEMEAINMEMQEVEEILRDAEEAEAEAAEAAEAEAAEADDEGAAAAAAEEEEVEESAGVAESRELGQSESESRRGVDAEAKEAGRGRGSRVRPDDGERAAPSEQIHFATFDVTGAGSEWRSGDGGGGGSWC